MGYEEIDYFERKADELSNGYSRYLANGGQEDKEIEREIDMLEAAISALESRVLRVPMDENCVEVPAGSTHGLCPDCMTEVNSSHYFCPYCGQRLDWREEV